MKLYTKVSRGALPCGCRYHCVYHVEDMLGLRYVLVMGLGLAIFGCFVIFLASLRSDSAPTVIVLAVTFLGVALVAIGSGLACLTLSAMRRHHCAAALRKTQAVLAEQHDDRNRRRRASMM